jgi:hypothetical protein
VLSIALRVALTKKPTDAVTDAEVEQERAFGEHAYARGFGLRPLFSGKLLVSGASRTPTARVASCWPWGTCLSALKSSAEPSDGLAVANVLRRASGTMLALDASAVRNYIRVGASWFLIDFDPYFTQLAVTDEQKRAARGFVAVQLMLMRAQMPHVFEISSVVREAHGGNGAHGALGSNGAHGALGSNGALAANESTACALVERVAHVAEAFPGMVRAMACVVQMYGMCGLGRPARVAMQDANVPDGMDEVIARGLLIGLVELVVRASLRLISTAEFAKEYAARFDPIFEPFRSSA